MVRSCTIVRSWKEKEDCAKTEGRALIITCDTKTKLPTSTLFNTFQADSSKYNYCCKIIGYFHFFLCQYFEANHKAHLYIETKWDVAKTWRRLGEK